MPKVLVLPDHIASQIAAGEVVERPASVVKELVENSVDAGASEIEIAISADCRDIRVADNGHGMEPEDAVLAFQRHATSKLRSAEDLWSLSTLGFRGEALPSVASISKFTCYTRTHTADVGTKITSSDGELKAIETGCAPGTVMEVQELFYNTPARLKFMKKAATEFGHIQEIVQSLAIAYTDVAFTLINDGEVVMRTSGEGSLSATIVQSGFFSGREALVEVLHDTTEIAPGFSIHGYMAKPIHFRGDRKGIMTIVNKRAVRCPLTLKALDYAYSDLIPRGRYPLAVIKVELDGAQVDVNIHPTKKELKYSNGNGLYLSIQRALAKALRQESIAFANSRAALREEIAQQQSENLDMQHPATAIGYAQENISSSAAVSIFGQDTTAFAPDLRPATAEVRSYSAPEMRSAISPPANYTAPESQQITFRDSLNYRVSEHDQHRAPHKRDIKTGFGGPEAEPAAEPEYVGHSLLQPAENSSVNTAVNETPAKNYGPPQNLIAEADPAARYELPAGWRMMGYLKNTYIFFETDEGLEIIEQHIAHERTLYERLLAGQDAETPGRLSADVQRLVVSAPLGLTADQIDVLKNCQDALTRLGFEFSIDDNGAVSVNQLPLQLASIDYVTIIQKMIEDIATVDATNMELEATKSIACQSAIKNGMPLSQKDILKLVSDWLKTERRDTCPHGRPVRLKYSMPELFQLFHPA